MANPDTHVARFNPRPRVGGDADVSQAPNWDGVSIHAPAWGATGQVGQELWGNYVSIHAPAWGATPPTATVTTAKGFQSTPPRGGRLRWLTQYSTSQCFNPRPRVGGDSVAPGPIPPGCVSIHAPAWGATAWEMRKLFQLMFQSTPPRGGRLRSCTRCFVLACFNPRPRVGGDLCPSYICVSRRVSIHAPAWGATRGRHPLGAGSGFQSTPPRGGRQHNSCCNGRPHRFNPRPRVGGDYTMGRRQVVGSRVSIHAPAWGATEIGGWVVRTYVFQSTPPRGGRPGSCEHSMHIERFQSTPPRGGRPIRDCNGRRVLLVSIHAPAWGATRCQSAPSTSSRFQSTPPRGGRPTFAQVIAPPMLFQSTPPRGGRQAFAAGPRKPYTFQSTPPRGGRRLIVRERHTQGVVSIHAPAWGATWRRHDAQQGTEVSIHAPAWGATSAVIHFVVHFEVSIHAPAWGATRGRLIGMRRGGFNPRPRVGGDYALVHAASYLPVSIHAPAWGATTGLFG